ncbi:PTS sugar transporter subunit IIB [[Clostridium] innocuum]|nr:PTS sugar transporter subunit IIB [[Clostridium] innocuum]MCR0443844.1 PTS sugar transporter subunit IIB [[Clostridium] innocuum]
MKIAAVCGTGLGSSFMIEMNIKKALAELGVTGIELSHYDLANTTNDLADVFVMGRDIAPAASHLKHVIALNSIIDKKELKEKMETLCKEKHLL